MERGRALVSISAGANDVEHAPQHAKVGMFMNPLQPLRRVFVLNLPISSHFYVPTGPRFYLCRMTQHRSIHKWAQDI